MEARVDVEWPKLPIKTEVYSAGKITYSKCDILGCYSNTEVNENFKIPQELEKLNIIVDKVAVIEDNKNNKIIAIGKGLARSLAGIEEEKYVVILEERYYAFMRNVSHRVVADVELISVTMSVDYQTPRYWTIEADYDFKTLVSPMRIEDLMKCFIERIRFKRDVFPKRKYY